MSNNFHLQLYRGTTAQNDAYTGLSGEVTVDTTLSKLRLHDGSTKGGVEIGGMPVGSIIPYAGTTIPAGYLLCDGSAISRTTYSALFASIGTTYGAGDGNSTFNLPTENDCFPCFPSSKYIDLSLGASGSTYTAPANGWFSWYCYQNNNGYIFVQTSASLLPNRVANASNDIAGFIPVKKGDTVWVEYANLKFNRLRFIYAEDQPSIIKY